MILTIGKMEHLDACHFEMSLMPFLINITALTVAVLIVAGDIDKSETKEND